VQPLKISRAKELKMPLPTPHGDKLTALLNNRKLPADDKPKVEEAIQRYRTWLHQLRQVAFTPAALEAAEASVAVADASIAAMALLLNEYRTFIDIELIFDSPNDFLYRQKGQLKLDNSIIEEFLPILVTLALASEIQDLDLTFGPTTCFSGVRFESSIMSNLAGGGITIRAKDQDFVISKKLFIKASHHPDFRQSVTEQTHLAYVAAECKTNLDKTMFQEAAATAVDVKNVVPAAKYYLLCEWLDMSPISTSTTAIDEIIILRKYRRLPANVRDRFNTADGRRQFRAMYVNFLQEHPLSADTFIRFINHIRNLFQEDPEETVLTRGYF
jgi:hypothetical protein